MSVRCSRAALASSPASSASSSAVHRPSFGRGWTSRSYANDVAPDRTTLRTVFRDTRRSRAISLIALPLRKYSRRIRPIVSTVSIPHHPRLIRRGQRITPHGRGGNFGRRYPRSRGQDCTPKHNRNICTIIRKRITGQFDEPNIGLLATRRVTRLPFNNVFVTNQYAEYKVASH